jgi:hypothetical protein
MLQFSMNKQHMPLEVSLAFRFHGAKWTLKTSLPAAFLSHVWHQILLHTVRSSTLFALVRLNMWLVQNMIHQRVATYCGRRDHVTDSHRTFQRVSWTKCWSPIGNHPHFIRAWNKTNEQLPHQSREQSNDEQRASYLWLQPVSSLILRCFNYTFVLTEVI